MPAKTKVCGKCGAKLVKVVRFWIHRTAEEFRNCGFASPKNVK